MGWTRALLNLCRGATDGLDRTTLGGGVDTSPSFAGWREDMAVVGGWVVLNVTLAVEWYEARSSAAVAAAAVAMSAVSISSVLFVVPR